MGEIGKAAPGPGPSLTVGARLWGATVLAGAVAGFAHYDQVGAVPVFVSAMVAIALTASVLGRAIDQVAGRLRPGAVGLFQAGVGNLPELLIGAFALKHGLYAVVQATVAGSVLNMLLCGTGLAYIAGGLRHKSLSIDAGEAQDTSVLLVLMVSTLVMPAVAVQLHTPAEHHARAVSFVVAGVLLAAFFAALPGKLSARPADAQAPEAGVSRRAQREPAGAPGSLGRSLLVLGVCALLVSEEADWLTGPAGQALGYLRINPGFAGMFLIGTVANLSQIGPAIRLSLRGDADTATAINLQGALQDALVTAPLLMLLAPLLGAGGFTLVFSPFMVVALVVAALLVVFVIIDGEVNHVEGFMLLGLYIVLGSLFWWS